MAAEESLQTQLADFDCELRNIKVQFGEQTKAFSLRTERKLEFLRDLLAFFMKETEIETQHAAATDKLLERYQKTRNYFSKRSSDDEGASAETATEAGHVANAWATLLDQSRKKMALKINIFQNLSSDLRTRLEYLEKETAAASDRCLKLSKSLHDDFVKCLRTIDEKMREYHVFQAHVVKHEEKLEKAIKQGDVKRGGKVKEKLVSDERKAMLARNDYLLALAAANAFKHRLFVFELSNLVDALDQNFHDCLKSTYILYHQANHQSDTASLGINDKILAATNAIDAATEKTKFFLDFQHALHSTYHFDFLRYPGDKDERIKFTPDMIPQLLEMYSALEFSVVDKTEKIRAQQAAIAALVTRVRSTAVLAPAARVSKNDDSRPLDNATNLAEGVGKLAKLHCQRTGDLAQLRLLGLALGAHCTPTASPADLQDEVSGAPTVAASEEPAAQGRTHKRSASLDGMLSPEASGSNTDLTTAGVVAASADTTPRKSVATTAAPRGGALLRSQTNDQLESKEQPASRKAAPPPPIKRRGDGAVAESTATAATAATAATLSPLPQGPLSATPMSAPPTVAVTSHTAAPHQSQQHTTSSVSLPAASAPPAAAPAPAPAAATFVPAARTPRTKPLHIDPANYKFGAKLVDVYNSTGADVPLAVDACVSVLQQIGLREEGLFRVPGSSNEVDEIKTSLELGKNPFVGAARRPNVEAVATCLKLYLRELADPVIPRSLYSEFVRIGRLTDVNARFVALRDAVHTQLPEAHRELLRVLLPFLRLVSQNSAANKMTTSNLALVFGPTLMPAPRDDMAAMLRDSTAVNNIMVFLIESCDRLFPDLFAAQPAAGAAPPPAPPAAAEPPVPPAPYVPPAGLPVLAESDDDDDDDEVVDPSRGRPNYVMISAEPEPAPDDAGGEGDEEEVGRLRAKHDYAPRNDTEIGFRAGDVLIVFENYSKDWSRGCNSASRDKKGFIANAYTEPYVAPKGPSAVGRLLSTSSEHPSFSPPPPPSLHDESTT